MLPSSSRLLSILAGTTESGANEARGKEAGGQEQRGKQRSRLAFRTSFVGLSDFSKGRPRC